jgi:hypothetical protein
MEDVSWISGTKFAQQKLSSLRAIIFPRSAYVIFTAASVFFFVIGIALAVTVGQLLSYSVRYDNKCPLSNTSCDVLLHIGSDMDGDLVLFYRLTHFYQNHRRYVTSRSPEQLAGEYVALDDLSNCEPLVNSSGRLYLPSGLSAVSFCNDTFKLRDSFPFEEDRIAWRADLDLFKPLHQVNQKDGRWLEADADFPGAQTNQHFVVWMRAAALSNVVKAFAICRQCHIPAGDYVVEVKNKYPTDNFRGEKWIGIEETGAFGGPNTFLVGLAFALGALWLACDVVIFIIRTVRSRIMGDQAMMALFIIEQNEKRPRAK